MQPTKLATTLFLTASLYSFNLYANQSPTTVATPAPYNWTGFYAGLNVGAVSHTMNITDNEATSFNATIQQVTNPTLTGGIQVGYRKQLDLNSTSGVYGLELSANFSNASFKKEYGSPFALYQLSAENELKSLCLLQAIGGIAADRTFLFLSVGLSWSNLSGSVTNLDSIAFFNSFNVNQKAFGTVLGGGAEYAFNNQFSARFKVDVITPNTYTVTNNTGSHYQVSNSITQATLGLNYKFA